MSYLKTKTRKKIYLKKTQTQKKKQKTQKLKGRCAILECKMKQQSEELLRHKVLCSRFLFCFVVLFFVCFFVFCFFSKLKMRQKKQIYTHTYKQNTQAFNDDFQIRMQNHTDFLNLVLFA